MMKELKMGGNGVFAPVKNDIETDVDLEQVKNRPSRID
jgi:hypothetical protein